LQSEAPLEGARGAGEALAPPWNLEVLKKRTEIERSQYTINGSPSGMKVLTESLAMIILWLPKTIAAERIFFTSK